MIRSIRVRFFLTVWPLVVLALVAVALSFGRWTRVELSRIESVTTGGPPPAIMSALADSMTGPWRILGQAARNERLGQHARDAGAHAVLLDSTGALVHATDPALRRADVRVLDDGRVRITRSRTVGGVREEDSLVMDGVAVPGGRLLILNEPPPPSVPGLAASARRTIWASVLAAALIAAAAALLLGAPVVRQVRRLASGAADIREGRLDRRVTVGSSDELGQLEASFNSMAESLERAESLKRQLVSDVAHELRTPLTNIIGSLEAVRDGLMRPDHTTIDSIRQEALLLSGLVDELQELSLAETGGLKLHIEDVDLAIEAHRALDACRPAALHLTLVGPEMGAAGSVESGAAAVGASGGDTVSAVIARADRTRLARVLRNLLSNAIRHTPPGGTVSIDVSTDGAMAILRVSDTGTGIPPDHLHLVWERFHRADPSRDRATGGMGIGLALVKQLVTAMGGSVAAGNLDTAGATFIVRLPAASRQA